jgi:periplasmic divalent cation tolerance protein
VSRKEERQAIVVFMTARSVRQGATIGRALVETGLAACVNLVPGVRSIFRWAGKVVQEREVLVVVKTRAAHFDQLAVEVKRLHSYEVPELIAIRIEDGSADYLDWLWESTQKLLN